MLRLLERARRNGQVSKLSVATCSLDKNSKEKLFSHLFGPASQQAGWASVEALVLKVAGLLM
jgi:hypothetical protein